MKSFKELVASRPLSELRTDEEAAAAALAHSGANDQTTEGETHPYSVEQSKPQSASLKDAEELVKYIAVREEMFKKAKEFDSRIIGFETAIRRPYFHVRPTPGNTTHFHLLHLLGICAIAWPFLILTAVGLGCFL